MVKTKENYVTIGKYTFRPKRFNEDGNLICALYRKCGSKKKCKLTGVYNFDSEEFVVTYIYENWFTKKHKKLLNMIFKVYEWNPTIIIDIKYGKDKN